MLTDAFNQRYLFESLHRELADARRNQHSLSLLLIDVDHLARLNTDHGLTIGDVALQRFATAIRRQLRPEQVFARWGGDEFAISLPGSDMMEATRSADRILAVTRNLEIQSNQDEIYMTVSIGVASLRANMEDAFALLYEASAGLNLAKQHGRDRWAAVPG